MEKADWTIQKPSYDELMRLLQDSKQALHEMADLKRENVSLKQQVSFLSKERNRIAADLQNHKRRSELLQKEQTPAMLQRATAYLIKQELEKEQVVKKLPMVKDVKTGKWVPKC